MVKKKKEDSGLFNSWSFTKTNYRLFLLGIIIIIAGYWIMATGETESFQAVKLAPVILIIGYCVVLPISILYRAKKNDN